MFFAVLLLLMRPLGLYIARVLEGEKTFLDPVLRPWNGFSTVHAASTQIRR